MAIVPVKDLGRPVCVGDRAITREDLSIQKKYTMLDGRPMGVAPDMLRYRGRAVTISKVLLGRYRVYEDCDTWSWVDGMFEGVLVADEDFGEIDMPEDTTLDFLLGG